MITRVLPFAERKPLQRGRLYLVETTRSSSQRLLPRTTYELARCAAAYPDVIDNDGPDVTSTISPARSDGDETETGTVQAPPRSSYRHQYFDRRTVTVDEHRALMWIDGGALDRAMQEHRDGLLQRAEEIEGDLVKLRGLLEDSGSSSNGGSNDAAATVSPREAASLVSMASAADGKRRQLERVLRNANCMPIRRWHMTWLSAVHEEPVFAIDWRGMQLVPAAASAEEAAQEAKAHARFCRAVGGISTAVPLHLATRVGSMDEWI